jgi:hypothetical protein
MAHPGASADDHQQPEVIEPALLRQAGVSHPEAATNPTHDRAVVSAQPIPVLQDAPLLESAAKLAASAPRFGGRWSCGPVPGDEPGTLSSLPDHAQRGCLPDEAVHR